MNEQELKTAIASKPGPKVTEESIKNHIVEVVYANPFKDHPHMTICGIRMVNGFLVLGQSAPISKENFDQAIGEQLAYKDAFSKIWVLEGYHKAMDMIVGTSADPNAYYANGQNPSNEA